MKESLFTMRNAALSYQLRKQEVSCFKLYLSLTISLDVFENIDPLEWVSIPDLFFGGEGYQNMLPALEMGADQQPHGTTTTYVHDQPVYTRPAMAM